MILRSMNMNWHFYFKSVCNWGHQSGRICRRSYKDSLWLAQCHKKRYPFTKLTQCQWEQKKFTLGQHVLHFNTQTPLRNARSPVGFGEMLANQSSRPGPTMKHVSSPPPIFQNRTSRSFLERELCFRVRLSNSNSDESFENLLVPQIVEFRTPVMLQSPGSLFLHVLAFWICNPTKPSWMQLFLLLMVAQNRHDSLSFGSWRPFRPFYLLDSIGAKTITNPDVCGIPES